MLTAIIVTFVIILALGLAQRGSSRAMIEHRPYNNRYNDAAGAREDHLG